MAVIVDQKRLGGGSHSTVGTITDIFTLLRLLFSRIGQPAVGPASSFSFNDPQGMCPECNGLGKKLRIVADDFVDMDKSLNEGAIQVPFFAGWENTAYTASGFFDNDKKISEFTQEELDLLLYSKPRKYKLRIGDGAMNATYIGIVEKVERNYIRRDIKTLSERTQRAVAPYLKPRPCTLCKGARLSQAVLSCKINGRNIAEMAAMEIGDLLPLIEQDRRPDRRANGDNAHRAAPACGRYRPGLPEPRPRNGHALGRRIAAHQDGQAPRQQPGGRHVHLR
jgi:excinuclease UvrABC ATPase subunit